MEMLFSKTTGTITADGDGKTFHEDYTLCRMEEIEVDGGFKVRGVLWGVGEWTTEEIESETLSIEDYFEGKSFIVKK